MTSYLWKKYSVKRLYKDLKTKWIEYSSLKENSKVHNKKSIRQKAEDIAESMGGDLDATKKQLLDRAQNKEDWRKVQRLIKESGNGGLNKLIIPDLRNENKRLECYSQKEIKRALHSENKRKIFKHMILHCYATH